MFFAIKTQNQDAMKLLLKHGADVFFDDPAKVDRSPIFAAVLDDSRSFYEAYYDGDSRKMVADLRRTNSHGLNMVTLAAYLKRWRIVTYFTKNIHEAIDQVDPEGYSPFMRLIVEGELKGAGFVLHNRANVNF